MSAMDFVALDVERANSNRGSICAIGLVVVRHGEIVERHAWLVRPAPSIDWFDAYNTALHGIGHADVRGAASFEGSLQRLLRIADGLPLVAHNAASDVGALRGACDAAQVAWPDLTYACSLVLARRDLDLVSYRLPHVADELGIELLAHHDAASDAEAAASIVLALARRRRSASLQGLCADLGVLLGRTSADDWRGCQRVAPGGRGGKPAPSQAHPEADETHPLWAQVMVFTGALSMRREDAWAQVAAVGAVVEANVTKRTNVLVIGDGFTGDDPQAFTSGKAAKAAALRAKGRPIEVMTEEDLRQVLLDVSASGRRSAKARLP